MLQVLLQQCFTTICAGGGGIPVIVEAKSGLSWRRYGVEAVIDKVCATSPQLCRPPFTVSFSTQGSPYQERAKSGHKGQPLT